MIDCISIYCCVTNHPKVSQLKTINIYYFSGSVVINWNSFVGHIWIQIFHEVAVKMSPSHLKAGLDLKTHFQDGILTWLLARGIRSLPHGSLR